VLAWKECRNRPTSIGIRWVNRKWSRKRW